MAESARKAEVLFRMRNTAPDQNAFWFEIYLS
jgi:hypothetical protein